MDFQLLTIGDIPAIRPFFTHAKWKTCDYTVGTVFMWRSFYRMEYCVEDGAFFSKLYDPAAGLHYNLPMAQDLPRALSVLAGEERGNTINFCTVPEPCVELISGIGEILNAKEEPDLADYLYEAEAMKTLAGRKLAAHRNHIHKFERSYQSWSFDPLTKDNLPQVKEFYLSLKQDVADGSLFRREEYERTGEVLDLFDDYGMFGGALSVSGRVVGFSVGETIGDTLYIHIEKGDKDVTGVYQMLTNQFVRHFAGEDVRYVNREEDMGDPGLRFAKQSYQPAALLKKYGVRVRIPE